MNNKEILENVQNSIGSMDKKAGLLATIVGIVFGLSIGYIQIIYNLKETSGENEIGILIGLYIAFSTALLFTLGLCVYVLFPRKKPHKYKDTYYVNYYKDLAKLSYAEFIASRDKINNDETLLIDQISINSKICIKKHYLLISSIIIFTLALILGFILGLLLIVL